MESLKEIIPLTNEELPKYGNAPKIVYYIDDKGKARAHVLPDYSKEKISGPFYRTKKEAELCKKIIS